MGRERLFIPSRAVLGTTDPGGLHHEVRFYAAAVLRDPDGVTIGTLHLADGRRRRLSVQQRQALAELARMCEQELLTDEEPGGSIHPLAYDHDTGCVSEGSLRQDIDKASYAGRPRVICMCVDNLHSFGFLHGWKVLSRARRELAARAEEYLGAHSSVAMIGTRYYAFIAPPNWTEEGLLDELHVLSQRLTTPIEVAEHRFVPRINLGASAPMSEGVDAGQLIFQSHRAAVHARDQGQLVALASAERDEADQRRCLIRERLEHALSERRLKCVVQPKFDMDLRVRGGEVLARWEDEELGFVSPGEFVPVAEECGLVAELGWCVIEHTCELVAEARARGHRVPPLAINVSTPQLQGFSFAGDLLETLATYGLTPSDIQLEITESVFSRHLEVIQRNLHRLAVEGVEIHLDDYGTGYSSLAYIKSLPISILKIDRTFIMEMKPGGHDATIVEATVAMAHALGLSVVAEGVEKECQWLQLRSMGCDVIQGFWCGRPMPFESFLEVVTSGTCTHAR